MPAFDDLPAELTLEILEHLKPIIAYDTADYADLRGPRFRENVRRTAAIFNVCITSKKLFEFAEPVLYSRLIFRTLGWSTHSKLFCLISALLRKPQLTKHVKYLENVVENVQRHTTGQEHPANSVVCCHKRGWAEDCSVLVLEAGRFWKGELLREWMVYFRETPGLALFALMIALSPNVSHLTLDMRRMTRITTFLQRSELRGPKSWIHTFSKLKNLCISTNMKNHDFGNCNDKIGLVSMLPMLRFYQHNGICHAFNRWTSYTAYRRLVSIRLENCRLPVKEVAEMIRDSQVLEDFVCHWHTTFHDWGSHWEILLSGLCSTSNTLRVLELKLGQDRKSFDALYLENVSNFISDSIYIQQSVSQPTGFMDLSKLKSLVLSDVMLLGQPKYIQPPNTRPDQPISLCLPISLEHLTIQADKILLQDNTLALWDLLRDLPLLPALRKVEILGGTYNAPFTTSVEKTADLITRFKEKGVAFVPLDWPFERRV